MIHEEDNDFRSGCSILAISTIRKRWADLLVCYKNSQGSLSKINATELNRNGEVHCAHSMSPLVPIPALLSEHTLHLWANTTWALLKNSNFFFKKTSLEFWADNPLRILVGIIVQAWRYRLEAGDLNPPGNLCAFYQKCLILQHSTSLQRFWCLLSLQPKSSCCKSLLQCW